MNKKVKTAAKVVKPAKPAPQPSAELGEFAKAATDINAVLKPNPLLNLKLDEEALSLELKALLPEIKDDDDLQLATWKTLKGLGWRVKASKMTENNTGKSRGQKKERGSSRKQAFVESIKKLCNSKTGCSQEDFHKAVIEMLSQGGKKVGGLEYECRFALDLLTDLGFLNKSEEGLYKKI